MRSAMPLAALVVCALARPIPAAAQETPTERTAAAEERIAQSHVGRGRDGQQSGADPAAAGDDKPAICRRQTGLIVGIESCSRIGLHVHSKIGQKRIGKIGVVEDIEDVDAQLHVYALAQVRVFSKGKIPIVIAGAHEVIPGLVAEIFRRLKS